MPPASTKCAVVLAALAAGSEQGKRWCITLSRTHIFCVAPWNTLSSREMNPSSISSAFVSYGHQHKKQVGVRHDDRSATQHKQRNTSMHEHDDAGSLVVDVEQTFFDLEEGIIPWFPATFC